MCHHYESIVDLAAEDLEELRESHSDEELAAELTDEELEALAT